MKRSFTNAITAKTVSNRNTRSSQRHRWLKILVLSLILTAAASTGASAQKTRDRLFPTFQKDVAAFQQHNAPDPRKTATVTRNLIFTNYQPGNKAGNGLRLQQRPAAAGRQQLPSDISAAEAARKLSPPAKNVQPQLPQQQ